MTVDNNKIIDGMGESKESNELIFLIADHLDWNEEYKHLNLLQNKINAYVEFIESKQFNESYPDKNFNNFLIDIHFKYEITENCKKFLNIIANQLAPFSIKIRAEIIG